MRHLILRLSVALIAASLTGVATAAKPSKDGIPFGNGFPSGRHHNVNFLGKKDNFTCPEPEFNDAGEQVYGNVIFIPREPNQPITVLMESGAKGPKGATDTSRLEVTDWCTETIPDRPSGNLDPAVLRLPANDKGYAVYARITGKAGVDGEPSVTISGGGLKYVEDEQGNDLLMLGLVDRDGTATFASDGETLYRSGSETWTVSYETNGSKKGNGVLKAKNLTDLFMWSGEVCYFDGTDFCGDGTCTGLTLCCSTATDGTFDACAEFDLVAEDDGLGGFVCPADLPFEVDAQCKTYDPTWVFNIADFVGYLWDLDSTGAYNIGVRFYPIP